MESSVVVRRETNGDGDQGGREAALFAQIKVLTLKLLSLSQTPHKDPAVIPKLPSLLRRTPLSTVFLPVKYPQKSPPLVFDVDKVFFFNVRFSYTLLPLLLLLDAAVACKVREMMMLFLTEYRAEMSVYDNGEKATFVLLCDTGPELTWRPVGTLGANHEMPTLQCLVEVSSYNFTVKRTITVTNVVSPAVLPPFVVAENNPTQSMKQHMLLE
ncbi:unnamed protein product [Eruca vesicaria subsp. sativa]|uniref:Uncharacterized protein n=1 Tax=Eruca vesicaria subsp. sativa TaxID=29727 RepID=A0ABC8M0R1_ERUVS|nr:unnamed protein product [Eruca vesicaria subsp. sativa]